MKLLPFLCVLTTVLFLASGCTPPEPNPEQMIAAAKELDQRFLDAFNSQDIDAMMATYMNSPDLVSFPPGGQMMLKGWNAVKETMAADFKNMKGVKLTFIDSHYEVAGNSVITWGLWRMTMPLPDGATMDLAGRYTDVKKEVNGKWVFTMDHASVPLAPPPAPAQ
jgi:ketosteroid isomerase-like protein